MGLSQTEIEVLLKMRADGQQSIDLFSGTLGKAGAAGASAATGVDQAATAIQHAGAVATAAGVALGEFATKVGEKLVDLGKDTVLTAARTEGLGAVAEFLGQRAGKSKDEVNGLIDSIKRQGVTTQESSNLVIQLARANLGLENATQLATVAQNGAFIAGESTAEAIGQIITGIVTLQPELIRSAGVTVSLEQSMLAYAKANHISSDAITTQQKQQLLLNAVLKEGKNISGVYALSMQYVGKQLTSLPRYIEEAKNAIGNELLPVLSLSVTGFTDFLKIIQKHPAIFVDLGVAVTAVVAPLLAAKAAAFLGIPTFAELAVSATGAASALSILGSVRSFGDLRAGIQLIGEASGLTFAKLGVLGTGAAAAAAAFAGWEFGRWIAGITGSDEAIGKFTAKLLGFGDVEKETAGANQDAIDLAFDRTGIHATTATEALELNTQWLKRHLAEASNDQEAINRLAEETRHFSVDMDGVSFRVGNATDSLHKFWEEVNRQQIHAPKIALPQLAAEHGQTLDPAKDAMAVLEASMNGAANVTKLMETRTLDLDHALQLMGSDLPKIKSALDAHTISAKDLVDTYKITQETAAALVERFKNQAEAAKKAAEEQKKWNEVVEEMDSLGTDYRATLDTISGTTLELARAALVAGANHESLAKYFGLTKTQLAALVTDEAEHVKMLALATKIEHDYFTNSEKLADQWEKKLHAAADAVGKSILDGYVGNLRIAADSQLETDKIIRKSSENTATFQIQQVRRWQDEQEGLIDYGMANWEAAYNNLGALAAAKIGEINRATNPVFQTIARNLTTLDTAISGTFAQMLLHAKGFGDGFVDIWRSIKGALLNMFADIANAFVSGVLKKIIGAVSGAPAGGGAGISSLFSLGGLFGKATGLGAGASAAAGVGGSAFDASGNFVGASSVTGAGAGLAGTLAGPAAGGLVGGLVGYKTKSRTLGVLSGAGSGAAVGAMFGGPLGAGLGAGVGALAGLVGGILGRRKDSKENAAATGAIGGLQADLLKTYGSLEQISKIGKQVGVDLAGAWGDQGKKGLENFKGVLEQFTTKVQELDAAVKAYGLTWQDMDAASAATKIGQNVDGLLKQQGELTAAGYTTAAVTRQMAPAWNDVLAAALKTGAGVPPALKPILVELEKMGLLTDDNKRALLGLTGASATDFKALEGVAKNYGIELAQLGSKFQQAHISDDANKIAKDFKDLTEAGADSDGVLSGMKDEIQAVVQQSLKFGSEIPAALKPLVTQLSITGQLFDENGHKIEDLASLKFAAPLEAETDKIVKAIEHLGEILSGTLPDDAKAGAERTTAELAKVRPPTIRVPYRFTPENELPDSDNPSGGSDPDRPGGAANGIFASRPTLAIFGEGGQPELGGPKSFFRDILESLGVGGGTASNQPAAAPTPAPAGGDTFVFQVSVIDADGLQHAVETRILPLISNAIRTNRRQIRTDLVQALGV